MGVNEITCRVLFFAALADRLGEREIELTLPSGASVADVVDALSDRGSAGLDDPSIAVAVNERYVPRAALINDGDTVAFIPPVSGG